MAAAAGHTNGCPSVIEYDEGAAVLCLALREEPRFY